jgi:predicted DNA-binding transcriptional regulator AlpA
MGPLAYPWNSPRIRNCEERNMANDNDLPSLLNDRQVATALNCSRSSVWRLTENGTLPRPLKISGMTRWRRSDIEALTAGGAQA